VEYRRITAALLLSSLVFTAACDDDDDDNGTGPQPQFATVRIVNAASGVTGNVEARLGGNTITGANNLAFGQASATCVQVPAGSPQTLSFRAAGGTTDLATTSVTLQPNAKATLVLFGAGTAAGAARTAVLFNDPASITVPAGQRTIRFINATADPGDLFFTDPNASLTGVTPTAAGLAANAATTTFGNFAGTNTQARLFATGTTTNPRATFTLPAAFGTGSARTLLLTTTGTPAGANSFLVEPCP
jgi:hypothetical protein